MPLRRSPVLTPEALAARRANALKSTGPRTPRGKQSVLLNHLRGGHDSPDLFATLSRTPLPQQLEFARLYAALYKALGPAPREVALMMPTACAIWGVKREMAKQVHSPAFVAEVAGHRGWLPRPLTLRFRRPGWQVAVSIGFRQDRGPTGRRRRPGWWDGRRPLHVRVTVRSSSGRIWKANEGPLHPSVSPEEAPKTAKRVGWAASWFKAGVFMMLGVLRGYLARSAAGIRVADGDLGARNQGKEGRDQSWNV